MMMVGEESNSVRRLAWGGGGCRSSGIECFDSLTMYLVLVILFKQGQGRIIRTITFVRRGGYFWGFFFIGSWLKTTCTSGYLINLGCSSSQ